MNTTMHKIETEFKLREHPMTCPNGFVLHLYCKYENPEHCYEEFPFIVSEFKTLSDSKKYAKRLGWKIEKNNTATCPTCMKQIKTKNAD